MTGDPVRRRQAACVAGLLPLLAWAATATPAFVDEVAAPCPDGICAVFERPSPEAVAVLGALGVSPFGYAVAVTVLAWALFVLCAAVALLLPRSRTGGLLVAVTAVLLPVASAATFGSALATRSASGRVVDTAANVLVAVLVVLFLGLFPDGRWHPRWFRWAWPIPAAVTVTSLAGSALVAPGVGESDAVALAELVTWLGLLGLQVHRFRRVSDWAARQQTKALLVVVVVTVVSGLLGTIAGFAGVLGAYQPIAVLADYGATAVLAVGLAIALFRYRLYGVDIAVRRTIVYGSALVLLAVLYVGLVTLAGSMVGGAAAPALAGAAVGVLALGGGLVAYGLRERLRRRLLGGHGLARAIAAVARDPSPGADADLAATIAQGLGLPHTAVLDADGAVVWAHGEPDGASHRESVVDGDGEPLGTLVLSPPRAAGRLDRHHRRVLAEVLPFVVLVLRAREEARLLRVARTAAAGAREDERRRLRRDLHDGVGPLLASQLLTMDTMRVAGGRPDLLAHLETQARSAIGEVRRVAHDLRPPALDTDGLPGAVAVEAERVALAGLPVELHVDLDGTDLGAAAEVALLRIAAEALANVVKHADATSATVRLTHGDGVVELVVSDDGRGRYAAPDGVGSASMRERAVELGGDVRTGAGPDGRGTRVHAWIPR